MATIVVFASSLSVLSIFVFIKALDLKFGNENTLLKLIRKADKKSEELVSGLRFRMLQIVQTVRYIILVQVKAYFKELVQSTEERIRQEYIARHEAIMGRRQIASNGSASFYLKKITETKVAGRGKIEQEF
jgi:hypothetical protein